MAFIGSSTTDSGRFFDTVSTVEGHKYKGQLKDAIGKPWMMDGKGVMYYTNSDVYDGEWVSGEREGMGVMKYKDGTVYEGEWSSGEPHGCGCLTLPNQDKYEGMFVKGERCGMGTEIINATKEQYVGSFKNNRREGRGILEMADGVKYEGCFKASVIEGEGTMTFPNSDTYTGSFHNGLMHGKGVYTFENGDRFEGVYDNGTRKGGTLETDGQLFHAHFKNNGALSVLKSFGEEGIEVQHDKLQDNTDRPPMTTSAPDSSSWKEGVGSIVYSNGDKYTGEFSSNQRNGTGVMVYSDGQYEGSWQDDKRHGKGRMTWQTSAPPPISGWRYDGEWKSDLPNGHGILLVDLEGSKYEGCWVDGKRSGLGLEVDRDYTYEGEFHDNKKCGKGKLTLQDGKQFIGLFRGGTLNDSKAKIIFSNGDTYVGEVLDGVMKGEGVITYANGDVYEGETCDDVRSGSGIITWKNGDRYEGMWSKDQMSGHGCIVYHASMSYEGGFKQNMKHGRGTWCDLVTNYKYSVVFQSNELVSKELVSLGEP